MIQHLLNNAAAAGKLNTVACKFKAPNSPMQGEAPQIAADLSGD
jgi:hypothetical protein